MTETARRLIWSNGLGTQSAAIAILIAQGKIQPPELSITADTGREYHATFAYAERYIFPLLKSLGIHHETVGHHLATVDLYAHNGDLLIPAFVNGGKSKLPTFCSNEWKRRVVMRRLRQLGYGPQNKVSMMLGMSRDEIGRMKRSDTDWLEHAYPLAIDLRKTRYDCIDIVTSFGWPNPPKSRCFMCPLQSNEEWNEIISDDIAREAAIGIDAQIFDSHNARIHRSGIPFSDVTIAIEEPKQPTLFDMPCDSGMCEF